MQAPATDGLSPDLNTMSDALIVHFHSDQGMRRRTVSSLLPHSTLDIPTPPARLVADWAREVASLELQHGDIEPLPLARTILRWADYPRCAEAVSAWLQTLGLPDLLPSNDVALMACRGTPYHHDAAQYGDSVFCNLFLSDDAQMDVHFAALGQRIPLQRGTVMIFDTAQPHAAIPRGSSSFALDDFKADHDCTQVFLTWELPLDNAALKRALHIQVEAAPTHTSDEATVSEPQVCLNGTPQQVCPNSGQWRNAD